MRKEVKKQKVLRFMADFETLTGKDVIDETYVWADVSAGVHWHWGVSASSDFFII